MEKDINKNMPAKRDLDTGLSSPLRFFSDDESFVLVFKKTQKLVSALYLITGFFDSEEPLKWKLRSLGSKLLSTSIHLKDGATPTRDKAVIDMRACVLEITSLFIVAKQAGMISNMNFEIVNKEFSLLLNSISHSEDQFGEETSDLKPAFFEVSSEPKQAINRSKFENEPKQISPDNNQTNTQTFIKDKTPDVVEESSSTGLLGNYHENPHVRALASLKGQNSKFDNLTSSSKKSEPQDLKEYGAVAVKKNSRQSIIIALLKRKKEIMIKDVAPLIQGCSEKTIQRELLAMVHLGILAKQGEKRWSKYSLLKP